MNRQTVYHLAYVCGVLDDAAFKAGKDVPSTFFGHAMREPLGGMAMYINHARDNKYLTKDIEAIMRKALWEVDPDDALTKPDPVDCPNVWSLAFYRGKAHAELAKFTDVGEFYPNTKEAKEVYELRKAAGLSQAQLAEKVGMSQSSIAMFEKGTRSVSPEVLEKIRAATSEEEQS